jgi:hypothetical protein
MPMRRSLAIGALALLVAGAMIWPLPALATFRSQNASSAPEHLVVGVVRNDGLLLPFAAFDGRKWSAPWPSGIGGPGGPDLPVSAASIPDKWWGGDQPGSWNLWPRDAGSPRRITLQSLAMMRVGASRQLGFRTDQPPVPPPVPPFALPFPKVGLAIAGDAQLAPIASVSSLSAQWKTLTASLRQEIDKAEERSIRLLHGNARWNHPFKPEQRARVQPELEAWYVSRLPDSPVNLSYVEAVKKYPALPADDGCGLETFVSGWLHYGDGQQSLHAQLKAVITYCDRRSVSYMLPFGQLRLAGKAYWVVQMSGRDHEWYAVAEGGPDQVKYVAEYQAGRIPFE